MTNLTPRIDNIDKNYIINGDMEYWQRGGTSSPVSFFEAANLTSVDRFILSGTGGTMTAQRSTDVPAGKNLRYSLQMNLAMSSPGTGFAFARQRIESNLSAELANNKLSFSFWYKTDKAQVIEAGIQYATAVDNHASVTDIQIDTFTAENDSQWHQIKIEGVDIPAIAANGLSVYVLFEDFTDSAAGTSKIAGMKVEKGSKSNGFCLFGRNPIEEFQVCERYYQLVGLHALFAAAGNNSVPINFKTQMRAIPTNAGVSGTFNSGTTLIENISLYSLRLTCAGGAAGALMANDFIRLDAEL